MHPSPNSTRTEDGRLCPRKKGAGVVARIKGDLVPAVHAMKIRVKGHKGQR